MQKVRQFFHSFDLFTASPILRARSEPQVANTFGGILSIIVLFVFSYMFISQLVQVFNWQSITFLETQKNDIFSKNNITSFPVGIGVEGFPLEVSQFFVRYQFVQVTMKGTSILSIRYLQKQRCQVSHFSQIGDTAQKSYNSMDVKNKMCLVPGQNLTISQPADDTYTFLSVLVNNCRRLDANNQVIYTGCQTEQNMNIGNAEWIKNNKYFTVVIVYINTAFNPTSKVPTTKYLDAVRTTFTLSRGSQVFVHLSPFQINTDKSILPFSIYQSESGYQLDYKTQSNFQAIRYFQNVNINFLLSSKSITIDRTVGKIDVVLSYAGGFFGIMISLLSIFMLNFNQYRYELMVGQGAFNYSQQGQKVTQYDFNVFQYVKYSIYQWVKLLTCRQFKWKNCKEIDQTRQQVNNQLDVRLLFRKIQHFQKVIQYLINDKQNIAIYLTEPPSLQQVRKKRRIAEYYDKVIKGQSANTVQDIQLMQNVFNFAMDIKSNQQIKTRAQLFITGSSSKRKLHDQPDKSRQNILQQIFENFKQDINLDDVDLDQDEQKLESQIASAFFRMDDKAKKRIQQKIPLKIIYRLKRKYQSQLTKQGMTINLQI